jgi:hypothetical protein
MGKTLAIIGGILALLGTFVFTWTNVIVSGWGIMNIVNSFNAVMGLSDQTQKIIQFIDLILFVMTVISGFMMLIGSKSRVLSVIFGLVAFIIGGLFIIQFLVDVAIIDDFAHIVATFGLSDPIVVDIIPYLVSFGSSGICLGSVVLAAGGLLGMIGGFTKNSED